MTDIQLFAQPYNTSLEGFYFSGMDEYHDKIEVLKEQSEYPELEIQFIDGESIDAQLFDALSISSYNMSDFLKVIDQWSYDEKVIIIIASEDLGYSIDISKDVPTDFDIDLYKIRFMKDLAMEFVDQGLFGEIPENISFYLDYDAIAYDLSMDYTEITVAGTHYIYRAG